MAAVVISVAAAAILGLLANWLLQRRDEARLGQAAERRLRADFESALEILENSPHGATEAWSNPGLRVTVWEEQFERLVPRFLPAEWERINGAVDALDRLQASAETDSDGGKAPVEPVRAISVVREMVRDLNARHAAWLHWRPWLRENWRLRGRVWRWAGRVVVVAILATIVVLAIEEFGDPLTAGAVEQELREMAPDAALVHCSGDDSKDRWRCTVVVNACPPAQRTRPCESDVEAESRLLAVGETSDPSVYYKLIDTALDRATRPRPPSTTERLRAWYRELNHKEPPVNVVPALSE